MIKTSYVRSLMALALAGLTLGALQARAQMVNLYVGIDNRQTLTFGAYAGLPNPNAGRLTLLYAHIYPYGQFHNNHYHGIGSYSYAGDAGSPTVGDTSSGNVIPEVYTQLPGNTLVPGTNGVWLGKLISRKTREHYSDLCFRSVHSLSSFGPGSSEQAMFLSSASTRTNLMPGASIALELVSRTAGLGIADSEGNPILVNVGAHQIIGEGDDFNFEYLPVFWVAGDAAPGDYQAEFRLVDVNIDGGRTPIPSSGRFFLKFRVPEAPQLAVAKTVTLTLPLVTDGWELVAAPEANGPWTVIPFPPAPDTTYTQSGTTYDGTFPVTADRQFYQLRRTTPPAN
ncbi:MAG TPA: PEP-CTERM sorting domain-containing protein [Verrucomicrobiales bacterium]|nr:PEP-CTERM sorting domain-containing protein [Verrucomicrobiales bacterium]